MITNPSLKKRKYQPLSLILQPETIRHYHCEPIQHLTVINLRTKAKNRHSQAGIPGVIFLLKYQRTMPVMTVSKPNNNLSRRHPSFLLAGHIALFLSILLCCGPLKAQPLDHTDSDQTWVQELHRLILEHMASYSISRIDRQWVSQFISDKTSELKPVRAAVLESLLLEFMSDSGMLSDPTPARPLQAGTPERTTLLAPLPITTVWATLREMNRPSWFYYSLYPRQMLVLMNMHYAGYSNFHQNAPDFYKTLQEVFAKHYHFSHLANGEYFDPAIFLSNFKKCFLKLKPQEHWSVYALRNPAKSIELHGYAAKQITAHRERPDGGVSLTFHRQYSPEEFIQENPLHFFLLVSGGQSYIASSALGIFAPPPPSDNERHLDEGVVTMRVINDYISKLNSAWQCNFVLVKVRNHTTRR
ncbi:hypothetical protein ACWJJH_17410 [Endozoicomonadaceae bacterium StTr2]